MSRSFRVRSVRARLPALVVCDHAGNTVPQRLRGLGLSAADRARHIAWDIGARGLALAVARELWVPCVWTAYSRLVIDCNRHLQDPSSILPLSDGTAIPANQALSAVESRRRAREVFAPYHRAIEGQLKSLQALAPAPALIAIHSFTPMMAGKARPWHCGILWDRDPRIAVPLMAALRAESGLKVGDNQPYSGQHPADYTIDVHAESRGWPHVCIEVRQDQLASASGIRRWARRLSQALTPILLQPALYSGARS